MTSTRARWLLIAIVFVTALWLYTTTATPGLIVGGGVESESAQLQRVANRLGIAHSTGYPLHTIIGYSAARLADVFGANPYTWITYTSAVASGIALVLFFVLALEVASPPAALAATALLMVTNTFWHISTITETQALHAISVIGLWWLTIVHLKQSRRFAPLIGMALLAGIGLANHRTIVFSIGAVGLAVLLSGAWRKLAWKQWLLLIVIFILPLLTYGYLFVRVQDPNVVFSTRPTWFPSELDNADVVDVIRGTLQSGEGLEGNLVLPEDDYPERWDFVWATITSEFGSLAIIFGLIGLGMLIWRWPKLVVVFIFYSAAWILFLMSWRLDWKAVVYYHALLFLLVLGLAVIASPPLRTRRYYPVLAALMALPLFWYGMDTYFDNRPLQDRSSDQRGIEIYDELAYLPQDGITYLYTGGWMPDTFILLEYLDQSGRRDIIPQDTLNAEAAASAARDLNRQVLISPALRGFFGLYSGSAFFHERGLSFSGTPSPLFFQLRTPDDPRLQVEADQATVVQAGITPEITLYSYAIEDRGDLLALTLYWQADVVPTADYAVFTHLREYGSACDDSTLRRLIAQDDAAGTVRNIHPTTWWQAGEVVRDTYFIPVPERPAGSAVVIGMTHNGERVGELCVELKAG